MGWSIGSGYAAAGHRSAAARAAHPQDRRGGVGSAVRGRVAGNMKMAWTPATPHPPGRPSRTGGCRCRIPLIAGAVKIARNA
ncbi:hypothetical protein QJS66_12860 [Kocuria rhizophila]|nr:hypothetical protein QJS66_12860 [Kocuria rhizophila]